MSYVPSERWRPVKVTDRRTKQDCAHLLKDLADVHFPKKKIVLVMDTRNTHHLATLYRKFKPEEAGCLYHRFEVQEIASWQRERNVSPKPIKWQFRTKDARIKLKSLYPSVQ